LYAKAMRVLSRHRWPLCARRDPEVGVEHQAEIDDGENIDEEKEWKGCTWEKDKVARLAVLTLSHRRIDVSWYYSIDAYILRHFPMLAD
jgi:hypothetical protein